MVLASWNKIKHLGLKDVRSGVNRIASDLIRLRLFEKPPNAAIRFSFHQTVGGRIVYRRQDNRRRRVSFRVLTNDRLKIEVREDIAVENDGRLANQFLSVLVGSRGAHRLRFDGVL